MALTILHPDSLSFAGNPIVVTATTNKSLGAEESFLWIVLEASFRTTSFTDIQSLSVEFSCPVEDGGTAKFNLSDAAQTLVQRVIATMDMNSTSDAPADHGWTKPVSIVSTYKLREVWLRDGYEQQGDATSEFSLRIVPGKLTDYEMLTMGDITVSTGMASKPMSRKPDMGIVYDGETVILPLVSPHSNTPSFTISVDGTQVVSSSGSSYLSDQALDYHWGTVSHASDGEMKVTSGLVGSLFGYYRTNTRGVHFLRFINGFGAVENIAVRAKDKLSYEVSGETHSLVQEISTRPTDRRYATKSQPVGVYELSSGYVPVRWAEWYVQELLTSPRVWIQLGGKWVPALIEAEDDCVIYDRTKPEMPHVDFTLRLAIDGVTGVTW